MENKECAKKLYICPAGKIFRGEGSVNDCLHEYDFTDIVDALKHEKNIIYEKDKYFKKWAKKCIPLKKIEPPEVFKAHVKTRFQTVMSDLQNTCYSSYWEKQLGTRRNIYPIPYPVTTHWSTVTFGAPTITVSTVKDLLNFYWKIEEEAPHIQVLNKRKRSIRSEPYRNPICEKFSYDRRGMWMKCCMKWLRDDLTVADSILSDFQEDNASKLGERFLNPRPM